MKEDLGQALDRLATRADKLRQKTEEVNSILDAVSQKLASMKLGVTVWLSPYGRPLLLGSSGDTLVQKGWQLGFSKVDDQWQLAARPVTTRELPVPEEPHDTYTQLEEQGPAIPLLKATRLVRVEACAHLVTLIDEIGERLDNMLKGIASATALTKAATKR